MVSVYPVLFDLAQLARDCNRTVTISSPVMSLRTMTYLTEPAIRTRDAWLRTAAPLPIRQL
jgi:hypothetical protein